MTGTERVYALLDELRFVSEDRHALAQEVRSLARRSLGPFAEEVKYGGILFSSGGVHVGGVFAYAKHVSVEFSRGASIQDPFGFLEEKGSSRCHVKLWAQEDLGRKHLAAYLPLALEASEDRA